MRYRVVNLSGRPALGQSRCDQIPAQYLSDRYNCELDEFKRKIQAPGYSQPGPNIQANPPEPVTTGGAREFPPSPAPTGPAPVATGGWSPGTMGPITTEPQPPVPNPNEVTVIVPRTEPEEPPGPEVNPPLTFMGPRGGTEPPPPPTEGPVGMCFKCGNTYKILTAAQSTGCAYEPDTDKCRPPVQTPSGGRESTITVCRQCPDGSFKQMNDMDAAAAGCTEVPYSQQSKCYPPVATTPTMTPSIDRFIPGPTTTPETTSTTATQGTRPTGMACPPGQNLLPDGSCGTPTGGPSSCGPGQFWDGRQCRGSVAPGFGGYGGVAFGGGGGMAIPGGLESGGGMTSAVSLMGRRYPVTNIGR